MLYFVDLPGYGYAKVSKNLVAKWGKMINNYLEGSKVLRLVFLLVDIRHTPNSNDIQMYNWCISYGFNPIIIATKEDKIKRAQKAAHIQDIKNTLDVEEGTPVIPFRLLQKPARMRYGSISTWSMRTLKMICNLIKQAYPIYAIKT